MAPKYKNDLDKSFHLLQLDYHWKAACEDDTVFAQAATDLITQLTTDSEYAAHVDAIPPSGDQKSTTKAITAFLADYGYPYHSSTGSNDFSTADSRMVLLRYLCTELMAKQRPKTKSQTDSSQASQASSEASSEINVELTKHLQLACAALGLPSPTADFDLATTVTTLEKTASQALQRCPPSYFGQAMLPLVGVSDRQWSQISRIAALLQQEYAARQATLLKRLDVTVQSFKWSDKAKSQLEAIASVYHPIRSAMAQSKFPGIPELLAVRDNMILRIEKTSGSRARLYTSCPLNKILMGQVPDRGGRAWEIEPPPPEMPSFKQRQPDQGRGGGRGGFSSGGRGGGGRGGYGDRGYQDRRQAQAGYSSTQQQQSFRPPAPSAQMGGADYVFTPNAYAALNQQMAGLAFEPGFGMGQPQAYVYQPMAMPDANPRFNAPYRGRGGRGRGRPPH